MTGRRSAVPAPASVLALLAVALVAVPFAGLLQRMPWSDLGDLLGSSRVRDAVRLSIVTSTLATAASIVLGVPLAWVLARGALRGRSLVRSLVLLPMVLPPVVGGVALLFALGRRGLVGQWLDRWFDIHLPFTTAGAVVAEAFVAMPFLVITVEGGLRAMDSRVEEAAATLGASRWRTFTQVTVPAIRPSLIAGIVLCWARALGEFGATITFAGNLQGRTQTLPLAVYLALEEDRGAALALALVLVAIALVTLAALRGRWLAPS